MGKSHQKKASERGSQVGDLWRKKGDQRVRREGEGGKNSGLKNVGNCMGKTQKKRGL